MNLTRTRGGFKPVPPLKTEEQEKVKLNTDDMIVFPDEEDLKPRLIISFKAFLKINLLSMKVDNEKPDYEVGGGGLITQTSGGRWILEDIFVPSQIIQPAFNSLDFGELINQGLVKYRVKDVRRVSFHFHKHPQSVTDFSGQDITQWHKVLDFEQPFIFLLVFGEFNYDKWRAVLLIPEMLSAIRMNVGFSFPLSGKIKFDLKDEISKIEFQKAEKYPGMTFRYGDPYQEDMFRSGKEEWIEYGD